MPIYCYNLQGGPANVGRAFTQGGGEDIRFWKSSWRSHPATGQEAR